MENCIFCKIIRGEIPTTKVYEDRTTFVFLDITPVNIGHCLIVPKEHFENIYTIPENLLADMAKTAKKVAEAVKSELHADGINIHMNNEEAAGQKVFHAHLHVIPRLKDDGFGYWHGKRGYAEGEKEEVAKKISRAL